MIRNLFFLSRSAAFAQLILAASVNVCAFARSFPSGVHSQVIVADNLGVGTADPLADADTVGEVAFGCGEHGNQVNPAKALIVDRQWFGAGWTANLDNFVLVPFGVEEGAILVADNRTQGQKPFLAVVAEFEGDSGIVGKGRLITEEAMTTGAYTSADNLESERFYCLINRKLGGGSGLAFEDSHGL